MSVTVDHYDTSAELRLFRRRFGLTIADVCELLNVDARTINRWESGKAAPTASAVEALRALEHRMNHRLVERLTQLKGPHGDDRLPFYRNRAELEAAEPFYRDLPSVLYEWEVAQLVDRVGIRAAYTPAWRQDNAYRAPHEPTTPVLEVTPRGNFRIPEGTIVPEPLREMLETFAHVQPAFTYGDTKAIAFASEVPLRRLNLLAEGLLALGITITVAQPWDDGPPVRLILLQDFDPSATVDLFLVDDHGDLVLNIAGAATCNWPPKTWADTPQERMPWL